MAVDKNKRIKRRVRNAYIVSTVSIALVLFLLGAVGYLIMGALNATERLKENVTVYVMLRDDITAEQSAALDVEMQSIYREMRGMAGRRSEDYEVDGLWSDDDSQQE